MFMKFIGKIETLSNHNLLCRKSATVRRNSIENSAGKL